MRDSIRWSMVVVAVFLLSLMTAANILSRRAHGSGAVRMVSVWRVALWRGDQWAQWEAITPVEVEGPGYRFIDRKTGKPVIVSGTVIVDFVEKVPLSTVPLGN